MSISKIVLGLFLSVLGQVWAQIDVCAGIPAGGKSLYDPGGSLHGVTQQDQDGVGTCYANVGSLILKSHNPQLPVPSYLHLAGFNLPDPNKRYDFDFGNSCTVLEEFKKSTGKLCSSTILENQPTGIQDQTLYSLYRALNHDNILDSNISQMYSSYYDLLADKAPAPEKMNCEDEGGVQISDYIEYKFEMLASPISYSVGDQWDPEEDRCAEIVGKRMEELWGRKGISKKLSEELNAKYLKSLKSAKYPSGKSQYDYVLDLLNTSSNRSATYEHVLGESSARAYQYQKALEEIVMKQDQAILDEVKDLIGQGSPEVKKCLDRGKENWNYPDQGLFFNTLLSKCHEKMSEWRNLVAEEMKACDPVQEEFYRAFRNLTTLGLDIADIQNFVVTRDQNYLKQIIENNCKQYHQFKLPAASCQSDMVMPGILDIDKIDDWVFYKKFEKHLAEYLEKYPSETSEMSLVNFSNFLMEKNSVDGVPRDNESRFYWTFTSEVLSQMSPDLKEKKNKPQEWLKSAKNVAIQYPQQTKSQSKKIVNSIRNGKAVGISICGNLLSDAVKKSYIGCNDHAVTLTGVQCIDGKLKLEISNSWGIGCRDDEKTKDLYQCQRDQDNLTNGRSWIDFDYLSQQGFDLYSY